ncbi:hypothetical protein F2Q69_00063116 [Brassica cretica]|uniref:Hexosyltransferase n=1 Tax=Brassica cretica TaxID=69181 RepID=A0A8S9RGS8_BRACR|nr:hypothetical protein F2Q69_00063116 [Brassica cretica]
MTSTILEQIMDNGNEIMLPLLSKTSVPALHEELPWFMLPCLVHGKTSDYLQLTEQMPLAKAYVFIAKEHNNLHLAWELSSKIRSCQLLLSKAAMRGQPISLDEAKPIVTALSTLIYKAQDAHYDIATSMMTMKSHIQSLEERAHAATVHTQAKFDAQACGWAFGMNVFDLIAWRKANVTGLLAFYGLTEPLDRRWHVLGLGYDVNIDNRLIETAAVIHYNGNMKPWLKLGIGRSQKVCQIQIVSEDCFLLL